MIRSSSSVASTRFPDGAFRVALSSCSRPYRDRRVTDTPPCRRVENVSASFDSANARCISPLSRPNNADGRAKFRTDTRARARVVRSCYCTRTRGYLKTSDAPRPFGRSPDATAHGARSRQYLFVLLRFLLVGYQTTANAGNRARHTRMDFSRNSQSRD